MLHRAIEKAYKGIKMFNYTVCAKRIECDHSRDGVRVFEKGSAMSRYILEVTDTFGGQANYSWVMREIAPPNATSHQIIRRLKAMMGLTGARVTAAWCGDTLEIRPVGRNSPPIIGFAYWEGD